MVVGFGCVGLAIYFILNEEIRNALLNDFGILSLLVVSGFVFCPIFLGVWLTIIGILAIIDPPKATTYTFDKYRGKLVIKKTDFIGRNRVIERSLSEISEIRLKEALDSEREKQYQFSLALLSGKRLPIAYSYDSDLQMNQAKVDSICKFLNIPLMR